MTRLKFKIYLGALVCIAGANLNIQAIGAPAEQKKPSQNTPVLKRTATRTLNFPKNLAVGHIYFIVESKKKPGEWDMNKDFPLSAQGAVVVPTGAQVLVKTAWAGAENLNWLQQLKADDLAGLGLQNMPITFRKFGTGGPDDRAETPFFE